MEVWGQIRTGRGGLPAVKGPYSLLVRSSPEVVRESRGDEGCAGWHGMPDRVALSAMVFNFVFVRDNKRSKTSPGRKTRTFIRFERKTHVVGKSSLLCALRSRNRCEKGNQWTLCMASAEIINHMGSLSLSLVLQTASPFCPCFL